MKMKNLNKFYKEVQYSLQRYVNGSLTKSAVTLYIASKLDDYRLEIKELNKLSVLPVEFLQFVKAINLLEIKFDLVDSIIKADIERQYRTIQRLRSKGYDKDSLDVLEKALKEFQDHLV